MQRISLHSQIIAASDLIISKKTQLTLTLIRLIKCKKCGRLDLAIELAEFNSKIEFNASYIWHQAMQSHNRRI